MSTDPAALLRRLDDFFCEGFNTDLIAECLSILSIANVMDDDTDSRAALEAYSSFKEYSAVVERVLDTFIQREGKGDTHENIATEILSEWAKEEGSTYLCTDYIAAALHFDAFKELLISTHDVQGYCIEEEDAGNHEVELGSSV